MANQGQRATAMVAALASAGAIGLGVAGPAAAGEAACVAVPKDRIAVQLYSLRDALASTSPADRPEALFAALGAIGFAGVERFAGTSGLTVDAYRAAADRHGLKVVGSHESLDPAGWAGRLAEARALGQTHIGSGGFGGPGLDTLEDTLETARNLNRLGEQAAAQGLVLVVHNHDGELTRLHDYDLDGDGAPEPTRVWEIIAAETEPHWVSFELDVHWTRVGLGVDRFEETLDFVRRHRDRIALLHVKDTTADGSIADLGRGTTDWARLFEAAGPGVAAYIWEHDNPADPLASARIAYDFLSCGAAKPHS
ncbi:sugar phosphate isomerase/epimerase family protein [Brevundimonas sp. Root1279]|uniref:sugar phosphate isomerase/epimerase family protein n=1 Tax=Brevundimonas sp. Root1279 TaxID=1736443 RepID=UPI0009E7BE1D|nr:sugar phosphate isomerase/epimerase [Brevundimonas sp. Root1279]